MANNTASDEIHQRTMVGFFLSFQNRLTGSECQIRIIVVIRQRDQENQTKITQSLLADPLVNVKNIFFKTLVVETHPGE